MQQPRMEDVDPEIAICGRIGAPSDSRDAHQRAQRTVAFSDDVEVCSYDVQAQPGIEKYPHAALALAMASTAGATWGTGDSLDGEGSTVEPSENEELTFEDC